jgi:2-hydroxy-6-oxo-octa-2,4-dienoate hydrolase
VLSDGAGEPLVLLHGGGSRAEHFSKLMHCLAPHFQVTAYDQRGFAQTGAAADTVIDHARWASDVVGIMDALELGRASLLGWSMGASVALNAAHAHPDRIAAVVLFGAPDPGTPVDVARLRLRQQERRALDAETGRQRDRADLARQVTPAAASRSGLVDSLVADRAASSVELQDLVIAAYPTRPDLRAVASRVSCPVHLFVGDHDQLCPLQSAQRMAAALPRAEVQVVPDCGHYYAVEQPEWLAQRIVLALGSSTAHD